MAMSPGTEANKRRTRLQDGHKQLIPGIPDDITLFQIVPKLPWKTFYILSSVSRAWLQGIQARQVYDARGFSHSAETLLVDYEVERTGCTRGYTTVTLCSPQDLSLTRLPPIPYQGQECQWVPSDGKIYLVAGFEYKDGLIICGWSKKLFVFDVAGQGQWKECASMNERREQFGCGIMHGKLYVFGGMPLNAYWEFPTTSCGSEVYDPEEDSWCPIRPMTTLRYFHSVEVVGDELFVLGGSFHDPDCSDYEDDSSDEEEDVRSPEALRLAHWEHHLRSANFLEVYHPLKDEWRVVNLSSSYRDRFLFVARGKLYSMDWSSVDLSDSKDNSFTHLHSL